MLLKYVALFYEEMRAKLEDRKYRNKEAGPCNTKPAFAATAEVDYGNSALVESAMTVPAQQDDAGHKIPQ